ncbi:MAG: GMP/IMP nucleotidase [Gammaproteobacteria bacterium]
MMPPGPEALDWPAIDAVLLDMDGTLLDLHFDELVWNDALPTAYASRAGLDLAQARSHIRATLDAARGTLAFYCLDHWSACFDVDLHAIETRLGTHVRVHAGVRAFLAWARARGLALVLATNAHPRSLARKLALTGLEPFFDDVVSAHPLGAPKEQAAFWRALHSRTGFEPARTLFIDDNPAVLAAARAFGIAHLLAVRKPDSQGPAQCHPGYHALESFSALLATTRGA